MKRLLRAVALIVIGAVATLVVAVAHPWHSAAKAGAEDEEVTVERATLRPGLIVLTVHNDARERVRIAQVLVDDALVNFQGEAAAVGPHKTMHVTIDYPWLRGEAYEINLVTSSGAMVDYEISHAQSA